MDELDHILKQIREYRGERLSCNCEYVMLILRAEELLERGYVEERNGK